MPNLVTHYNLARVFYAKKVENGFLKGNFECLALGTQGPDPLFYEGIVPTRALRLRLASAKLGNQIHRSTGENLFHFLLIKLKLMNQLETMNTKHLFLANSVTML